MSYVILIFLFVKNIPRNTLSTPQPFQGICLAASKTTVNIATIRKVRLKVHAREFLRTSRSTLSDLEELITRSSCRFSCRHLWSFAIYCRKVHINFSQFHLEKFPKILAQEKRGEVENPGNLLTFGQISHVAKLSDRCTFDARSIN